MKTTYVVHFFTGITVTVDAFTSKEAMILAQAEQIKAGNDYRVDYISRRSDHEYSDFHEGCL